MKEVWKSIEGYEDIYQISNIGNVRSLPRIDSRGHKWNGKVLKPHARPNGYFCVHLSRGGIAKWESIHRLVAKTFLEKQDGCDIVNHVDNDRSNNRADNLEWTTYTGNMQHATKQGRMHHQPENLRRAQESRKRPVIGESDGETLYFESAAEAERSGFNHRHISNCCLGKYGYKTHKGLKWRYI